MLLQKVDSSYLSQLGIINPPKEAWLLEKISEKKTVSSKDVDTKKEEKTTKDSIKVDSIQVPYPVERNLTKWEKVKMDIGGITIGACVVILLLIMVGFISKVLRKT